ncbi:MAG TPA: hypothetical protein VIF57_15665, partial [Polyangia bacterium]
VAAPARVAGSCAAAVVELAGGAPRFVADGAPLFAGLDARAVRGRGAHEHAGPDSEEARCASLAFSCRS